MLRNCEQFGQKKIFEGEIMQIYPEILKVTNVKFLLYSRITLVVPNYEAAPRLFYSEYFW